MMNHEQQRLGFSFIIHRSYFIIRLMGYPVLEPLATGDIIDRAVRVYRQNFAALLTIVAGPGLVTYIGTLMTVLGAFKLTQGSAEAVTGGLLMFVGYVIALVVGPLLNLLVIGGLSRTVADCFMLDKPIEVRRTFEMIKERLGTLLGGQILGMLIGGALLSALVLGAYFCIGFLAVLLALLKPSPQVILIVMLAAVTIIGAGFFVGYSAVYSRIVFIPCSIMIEGHGASSAISRSFRLGKGNAWRFAQLLLFDFAIAAAIIGALGVPLGLYGFFSGDFDDPTNLPPWVTIAYGMLDQLAKLLTVPIATIAYSLLYFDSRVRQEGYDVELIAGRIAPMPPPPPPPPPTWTPPPATHVPPRAWNPQPGSIFGQYR